jgi:2-polyprenyl-3-methyl-5-hydroxy-6-metoxy-1,4-benzoquinol methylase
MSTETDRQTDRTLADFKCILCGNGGATVTGKHPRDQHDADIVVCGSCGHLQMFPLMSPEWEKEEYNNDASLRNAKVQIAEGSDFATLKRKFSEWTKIHADMYFEKLQQYKNILEIASGYGFFMEDLNNRPNKKFNIEGVEIGAFRRENFVGGTVHNINFVSDTIPPEMREKYDFVICMHLLEHLSDPVQFLKNIKPLLTSDGKVLFEVPNIECWLDEISKEYYDFSFLREHYSYWTAKTLRLAFEKADYEALDIYTREVYSIENHINWLRTGKPFIKYNQMFMPDERIEWINEIYKERIGKDGKGYALIIEAKPR